MLGVFPQRGCEYVSQRGGRIPATLHVCYVIQAATVLAATLTDPRPSLRSHMTARWEGQPAPALAPSLPGDVPGGAVEPRGGGAAMMYGAHYPSCLKLNPAVFVFHVYFRQL